MKAIYFQDSSLAVGLQVAKRLLLQDISGAAALADASESEDVIPPGPN